MQRSHTLPFVLTLGAACGSGPSGPKAAPSEPNIVTAQPVPTTSVADAGVAVVDRPKLVCEDGTTVTAAPHPEPTWFCARSDSTRHGSFITLFPDQEIEIAGRYNDGKLDGAWQRVYPGGRGKPARLHLGPGGAVAETGAYSAGLADGAWKQFSRDGALLGESTLVAGTGTHRRWLIDGPLYSEATFKAGVLHGPTRIFDRTGHVVVSASFDTGKLDGKHVVGTKNMLRIEEKFSRGVRRGPRKIWQFWALLIDEAYDSRGKHDGAFAIWRANKVPRVQGTYAHGNRIGTWVWTDDANTKEREGNYVAGKKTGTWSEWIDGKLTFQGIFSDGKPDGEFSYYDTAGNELGRFTVAAGTGTMVTYHLNKQPSTKTRIVKGLLDGKYEAFTVRGKLVVEGHYASDRKHGWWREWTETGVLVLEQQWKRGKLDGAFNKYVDGKLSVSATYKDGMTEGAYAEFRNGKPAVTATFTAGRRTGTWTSYDADGAVTLTATYNDGVLDGPWRQRMAGVVVEGQMAAGRRVGTWTQTDRAGVTRATTYKTP